MMHVQIPDPVYIIDLNEVGRVGNPEGTLHISRWFTTTYGPGVYVKFDGDDFAIGQMVRVMDSDHARPWFAHVVEVLSDAEARIKVDA